MQDSEFQCHAKIRSGGGSVGGGAEQPCGRDYRQVGHAIKNIQNW